MDALLAQLGDEVIAIVGIVMLFGIPIVAILTHHQRKMAEFIHRQRADAHPVIVDELNRLRAEVQSLRTDLNETRIALDDVSRIRPSVEQRVREER